MSHKNFSARRGPRFRCGARTRACRVHTRVNACRPLRIRTRPFILLDPCNQSGLNGVVLNIPGNPIPFAFISDVVIVGFPLPKLLSRPRKDTVGFSCRYAFQRLQQQTWIDQRPQQHVNVIRHNHPRAELIIPQRLAAKQGIDDEPSNQFLSQVNGSIGCRVQVTIDPNECLASRNFTRRRVPGLRKAAMQMPSNEQPAIPRVNVRKAPLMHLPDSACMLRKPRVHTSVNAARKSACATAMSASATSAYD